MISSSYLIFITSHFVAQAFKQTSTMCKNKLITHIHTCDYGMITLPCSVTDARSFPLCSGNYAPYVLRTNIPLTPPMTGFAKFHVKSDRAHPENVTHLWQNHKLPTDSSRPFGSSFWNFMRTFCSPASWSSSPRSPTAGGRSPKALLSYLCHRWLLPYYSFLP